MRTLFILYLVAATGCALSSTIEDGMDDVDPDAPPEIEGCVVPEPEALEAPAECEPHEFWGCSYSMAHWFWNGSDCEVVYECADMGFDTRLACLDAHQDCGAPDPCSAVEAPALAPCEWEGCGPEEGLVVWTGSECQGGWCCTGSECEALQFADMDSCLAAYASCSGI